MLTNLKIQLAQKAAGRILLHLGCLLRGGRWDFHWTGVRRELACLFKYKNFVTGLGSRHKTGSWVPVWGGWRRYWVGAATRTKNSS